MTILTYYEFLLDRNLSHSPESYKKYRKYYQRLYQRKRRREHKEITLLLHPDNHIRLRAGAIKHNQSLSRFIESSALAYLDQKYITPDKNIVASILQKVSLMYSYIQQLLHEGNTDSDNQTIKRSFDILLKLEHQLEQLLTHPDSLETVIYKTLHAYPNYYQTLTKLLKAYDHQNQIN